MFLFLVPSPMEVNAVTAARISHIDFSQLDMFIGLLIGVAVTGVITGLVIWALIKAKVINLGAPIPIVAVPSGVCGEGPTEHLVRIQVPRDCNEHKAEAERSKRNERGINDLWENYGKLRDTMTAGFDKVNATIQASQGQILGALAGSRNGFQGPGKGGSGGR